jgi:hypothetical protein
MKNKFYNYATSSFENYVRFIVHSQYPHMINSAIGARLVNSSVTEDDLADSLIAAFEVQSPVFDNVMDFELQTSPGLAPGVNEAIQMLKAKVPQIQMKKTLAYFCDPNFSGALSPEQEAAVNSGACEQSGGWSTENTNTAIGIAGQIFGAVTGWFEGKDTPPANTGGPDNPKPDPTNGADTDYMPYVFGGSALLIIIIVAVLLYLKTKGK